MKQLKFTILLTLLICLVDAKSFAYTAEIDGIYYDFGSTEATVTYYEYGSGNVNAYSGNVVIPENVVYNETSYSVTSIGFAAFSYCSGITSLTIPNSVTSIEALAFWKCSNLKSLTISSSLTIIGNSAFDGCHPIIYVSVTDLSAFCSNKVLGLLPSEYSWNVHLLDKDGIEIKDYVIPNDVTSIGSSAFKHCSGLSSITIPKSVANIGDHAFMGCSGLLSMDIPNSVNSIGDCSFWGCSGLHSISIPSSVSKISNGCFMYCRGLISVDIPSSVTLIGDDAFSWCNDLPSITIPNSVTSIGKFAFGCCESLSTVILSNSMTSINESVFQSCSNLSSVIIPNSITSIGAQAFEGCSNLTSITLPDNLSSIGEEAFYNCSSLTSIVIPENVTSIEKGAFSGCRKLSSAIIGDNIESIEDATFAGCGLTAFTIGNNIVSIGNSAFSGCSQMTSLTIGNNVTSIGNRAFYGCNRLSSISIPNSVNSIGELAFADCSMLTSINIPENLNTIKKETFSGCSRLENITIPAKIEYIYQEAFANCNSLKLVHALSTTPPFLYDNSFSSDTKNNALLLVPKECCETYKNALGWKSFTNISGDSFALTYIVDGEEYKTYEVEYGTIITPEPEPTKEGFVFSGWNGLPETMPAHVVIVTGSFSKAKYMLTYMVDDEVYKSQEMDYGATITPEPTPTKEGHTFSGWSEIPATMPAHDVTVTGFFFVNKYILTYILDGKEYKTMEMEYGKAITPEPAPEKEGYTFSGWSEIPETMPAHIVIITGSFSVNSYTLTYMIDEEVYKQVVYEYGAAITPEPQPEGDYVSFEWVGVPETMPAHDVTVTAVYETGIAEIIMMAQQGQLRIYSPNGKKLDKLQKGLNIVVMQDGTTRKVVTKSFKTTHLYPKRICSM